MSKIVYYLFFLMTLSSCLTTKLVRESFDVLDEKIVDVKSTKEDVHGNLIVQVEGSLKKRKKTKPYYITLPLDDLKKMYSSDSANYVFVNKNDIQYRLSLLDHDDMSLTDPLFLIDAQKEIVSVGTYSAKTTNSTWSCLKYEESGEYFITDYFLDKPTSPLIIVCTNDQKMNFEDITTGTLAIAIEPTTRRKTEGLLLVPPMLVLDVLGAMFCSALNLDCYD